MSDSERENREWRFYVQDMLVFGEKVLSYTDGLNYEAFVADGLTYDATLRNIQLIGKAATHIPTEVRESHPEVPWRAIIGARNRVVHAYLGIDDDVVWDIIQTDVPDLLPKLRGMLESEEGRM